MEGFPLYGGEAKDKAAWIAKLSLISDSHLRMDGDDVILLKQKLVGTKQIIGY